MIEAIGRANWPCEHIQMMADFWANLQEHPFHSSMPFKQQSLLIYQAEQRRLWHITIIRLHSGYNLSIINKALLHNTKEDQVQPVHGLQGLVLCLGLLLRF